MTPKYPPYVYNERELEWAAERFMNHLKWWSFRKEISPDKLTSHLDRFVSAISRRGSSVNAKELLLYLHRMEWVEPSAGDTYVLRHDKIRK
jgi:hypothetical protein